MEPEIKTYAKSAIITTDNGNKVSRKAHIYGSQNIVIAGTTIIHDHAIIRGDLRRTGPGHAVSVAIGNYVHLGSITLRPPFKIYKNAFSYYPMKIGDNVIIEDGYSV
jgi:dynactin 5